MLIHNDNLIVSCGDDSNDCKLNDMHVINANDIINNNKPKWKKVNIKMPYMEGMTLQTHHSTLYGFGGENRNGATNLLFMCQHFDGL